MQKHNIKGKDTRLFIVQRTAEMFNKKGYSGTTMTDVEMITGLSRGAIYHYFGNKESLALAVFDYNFEKLCAMVADEMRYSRTFYERLVVYIQVYLHIAVNDGVLGGSPLFNTASEADDTNELLTQKVAEAILKKEGHIANIVEMGMKSGEFKKGTDPQKIAMSILSSLEGGLMISRATNDLNRMHFAGATVKALVDSIAI